MSNTYKRWIQRWSGFGVYVPRITLISRFLFAHPPNTNSRNQSIVGGGHDKKDDIFNTLMNHTVVIGVGLQTEVSV